MDHVMAKISSEHSDTRFIIPVASWDEFGRVASTTADALDLAIEAVEQSNNV
jgi:hypothetical protein